tara:strand:+ start:210 stop:854 length:645 start_codon:yes stop_codon:yes gene_type:complete
MNNKVEYIGHYGSDKLISCSAWTSTSRNLTPEKINRIPKMLDTLWANFHETPFEKGLVHFLVDTDIASHIHILKHRMSSMNGESARYKELKEDKFYIPSDFPKKWKDKLIDASNITNQLYHECLDDLSETLGRKRAKESARFFKMYNSQIEGDVSFNMRSFYNFLNLRNSPHAQKEIREVAQEMRNIVLNIDGNPFKKTMELFDFYETIRQHRK